MAIKPLDFAASPLHHNLQHVLQPISLPTVSLEQHCCKGREGKEQQSPKGQRVLPRVMQGEHAASPLRQPHPSYIALPSPPECSWMVMKHLEGIDFFVLPGCGLVQTGIISSASLAGSSFLISRPLIYSSHLHYWFKGVCPAIIALTRNSA